MNSKKEKVSVFLGGTTNGHDWRLDLINLFNDNVDYFDPYLRNDEPWDEIAREIEEEKKITSDYNLFVINSNCVRIPFSLIELASNVCLRPGKTILYIDLEGFNEQEIYSANAIKEFCEKNNGIVCNSLKEIADFLNNIDDGM